jgi:hypothetical protein
LRGTQCIKARSCGRTHPDSLTGYSGNRCTVVELTAGANGGGAT